MDRREYKIVIAGVEGAGKTALLYKLLHGRIISTESTVGANVEQL